MSDQSIDQAQQPSPAIRSPIDRKYIAVVERAQRGDVSAFSELVIAFQDLVLGTAFSWLGDIETARDVSQEAFIEVHAQLQQLREPAAFPAWLRAIVIKQCDRMTRRRRLPVAPFEQALNVAAQAPVFDAEMADAKRVEWARLAVAGLPATERLVVALHYFADVSGPELAEFLQLPLSTIKQRLRRARARLRDDGEQLTAAMLKRLRPSSSNQFSDEVLYFMAVRAGDQSRVQQLLTRAPALINARQSWDPKLAFAGIVPFASRATALITAIERDDLEMQKLLVGLGADVDGACECSTNESPLWAAALFNRIEHLRHLLAHGANPSAVATSGTTPLHVAAMRGYLDIAAELVTHGARVDAVDGHGRTPADWASVNGHTALLALLSTPVPVALSAAGPASHPTARPTAIPIQRDVVAHPSAHVGERYSSEVVCWSGIKALDLFAPIPRGGLIRCPFRAEAGMRVLLGELCKRMLAGGARAIWTGFTSYPFDTSDWEAELAEFGVYGRVEHSLSSFDASPSQRREAFTVGLDRIENMRNRGDDVLVVLFGGAGFEADVDASLVRLSRASAPGRITTVLVTPFSATPADAWTDLAAPYKAQIVTDTRRARHGLFPALDPLLSFSKVLSEDSVGARHVAVASRARDLLKKYACIDPDFESLNDERLAATNDIATQEIVQSRRLLKYLRQRFVVAEPFTGSPGEWVSQAELLDDVEAILNA